MIRMTRSDRPYRGVEAAERLATRRRQSLSAGLDLLGSDQHDIAELTIRTICRRAGLSVRYFYESFTDKDEFVGRVFDWVVAELVATTQAAVTAVPAREQTRATTPLRVSALATMRATQWPEEERGHEAGRRIAPERAGSKRLAHAIQSRFVTFAELGLAVLKV